MSFRQRPTLPLIFSSGLILQSLATINIRGLDRPDGGHRKAKLRLKVESMPRPELPGSAEPGSIQRARNTVNTDESSTEWGVTEA